MHHIHQNYSTACGGTFEICLQGDRVIIAARNARAANLLKEEGDRVVAGLPLGEGRGLKVPLPPPISPVQPRRPVDHHFAQTLVDLGQQAAEANQTSESSMDILAVLSKNMIKGEEAGARFREMLTKLQAPPAGPPIDVGQSVDVDQLLTDADATLDGLDADCPPAWTTEGLKAASRVQLYLVQTLLYTLSHAQKMRFDALRARLRRFGLEVDA